MAKGNMFQGMARGKVGDVVFSRLNGEQVSRVRNRHPKNPRTNKQLYQRAIMATIMQAYSAGKEIFDHAFEGYEKGSGCQRKFMSVNAKALRSALAADLHNRPANVSAILNAPSTITPVPNTYIVSEGQLKQNFFKISKVTEESPVAQISMIAPIAGETYGQYMSRAGLVADDIYTFVFFALSSDDENVYDGDGGVQARGMFGYVQLKVKSPADADAQIAADTEVAEIFDIVKTGNVVDTPFDGVSLNQSVRPTSAINISDNDYDMFTLACILSRENAKYRSSETMQWIILNRHEGLNYRGVLYAWQAGATSVGDSELILEGSEFEPAAPAIEVQPAIVSVSSQSLPISKGSTYTISGPGGAATFTCATENANGLKMALVGSDGAIVGDTGVDIADNSAVVNVPSDGGSTPSWAHGSRLVLLDGSTIVEVWCTIQ